MAFTGIHLVGLSLDSYVRFDVIDLLIPFASPWRPLAVAWGVIGLYLLLAVELTSLARRRLPHRLWRRVHLGAFPLLVAGTAHLLTAGTDRATRPAVALVLTVSAAATFLLAFRVLQPSRRRPPKAPPPRGRAGPSAGQPRERGHAGAGSSRR